MALTIALAAALMLSACNKAEPVVVKPNGRSSGETATTTPTDTPTATPVAELKLELAPVVSSGLEKPLFLTNAADGSSRLFVVQQTGAIRVIRDGALLDGSYLDLSGSISAGGERGLLGLAFAPDFERSGRFYVDYTDPDGDTIVARYTSDDPASDKPGFGKPEVILRIPQPYANHNGGMLAFAPDGTLCIGMGDGGSAGDPQNRAQDLRELLGKVLRIDTEGASRRPAQPAEPYGIPRDNPFQFPGASPSDSRLFHRPEIWQWGVRNPWRFSFDRSTGDLWIGDVGQSDWEEIDFVPFAKAAGVNWGWRRYEGTHPYPPGSAAGSTAGLTFPIVEYSHSVGKSVTGGYVYRGSADPALRGVYLYGDFETGKIWGLRREGADGTALVSPENALLLDSDLMLASFGEDEDGELYAVDLNGAVYRIGLK